VRNYQDTILLISNDPGIMTLFSMILSDSHCSLQVALDQVTSFEILKNRDTRLMILDMSLESVSPPEILKQSIELRPDLPKIILADNSRIHDESYAAYYPYLLDIVIKPVQNQEEFRMRINRGIDHVRLLEENREYQKKMIEYSFRDGLFEILSSIVNRVNNHVDEILADLLYWKSDFSAGAREGADQQKVNDLVSLVSRKLFDIEEMIQLNDVVLKSSQDHSYAMINGILGDIISIQKRIFQSKMIDIRYEDAGVKPTAIDAFKIARIFFYVFDALIRLETYFRNNSRNIRVFSRVTRDPSDREWIETGFDLTLGSGIQKDQLSRELKALEESEWIEWIRMIGGRLQMMSEREKDNGMIRIFFPVIEVEKNG
jgi:CheY-like chemotaxis protein